VGRERTNLFGLSKKRGGLVANADLCGQTLRGTGRPAYPPLFLSVSVRSLGDKSSLIGIAENVWYRGFPRWLVSWKQEYRPSSLTFEANSWNSQKHNTSCWSEICLVSYHEYNGTILPQVTRYYYCYRFSKVCTLVQLVIYSSYAFIFVMFFICYLVCSTKYHIFFAGKISCSLV